jgi:hypothetical protein
VCVSVELNFSINDEGNVSPLLQKLHYLPSFVYQLRPAGGGFRILFETPQFLTLELEIHFAQSRSSDAPNGKTAFLQCDALGVLN